VCGFDGSVIVRNRIRSVCLAAIFLGVLAPAALAQTARIRIRGDIDSLDGNTLHVTSRQGEKINIVLAPNFRVTAIAPSSLENIKPNTYIGTAALPQPDGSLLALEVQVFPESARGAGEGSGPFDTAPNSTMTNGTVGNVTGTSGRTMTVKYHDKSVLVNVPPDAPVITYEPATAAMLTPGAHVIVFATKDADGTITATGVNVGKDGLVPPM
jgi:hypothetical protein